MHQKSTLDWLAALPGTAIITAVIFDLEKTLLVS